MSDELSKIVQSPVDFIEDAEVAARRKGFFEGQLSGAEEVAKREYSRGYHEGYGKALKVGYRAGYALASQDVKSCTEGVAKREYKRGLAAGLIRGYENGLKHAPVVHVQALQAAYERGRNDGFLEGLGRYRAEAVIEEQAQHDEDIDLASALAEARTEGADAAYKEALREP